MANDFESQIMQILNGYSDELSQKIEKSKKESSKIAVDFLKENSPKKTGDYARSWASKKQGRAYIVYNKKHWARTHLLENGHAKRNGGRVQGVPHISKAEKLAVENFEKSVNNDN